MSTRIFVVTAAGGNPTLIEILKKEKGSPYYAKRGKELLEKFREFNPEQAGFLIPAQKRFEMSGGEFCGNAARSAALILSRLYRRKTGAFNMSGYDGKVNWKILKQTPSQALVVCEFPNLDAQMKEVLLSDSFPAKIVDLGGIVHVVITKKMPTDFATQHQIITTELSLRERAAVGVVWCSPTKDGLRINPVVWVKDIDTFFYETSCGSGSIAAGLVYGVSKIVQPTSQIIWVGQKGTTTILKSKMEIKNERTEN